MHDPRDGAVVVFEGLVRNHHQGRPVEALRYSHHPAMAQKTGQRILDEALAKFDITAALAVHRTGDLQVGHLAVVTITTAPHREAAFAANQYLIDTIKSDVPIWKFETYSDGPAEWTAPCPSCQSAAKRRQNA